MKTIAYLRQLPAFLLFFGIITTYGQGLPTLAENNFPSTLPGYDRHPDYPAERRLSKRTRLPGIAHEGEVVLTTGERLRGPLIYQPLTNSLQVWQANTLRTYQADQLRYFVYTDRTDNQLHYVTAFTVRLASGERQTLLLDELIPGAPIPLLQLPLPEGRHESIIQGLPLPRTANWRTEQPCFVWFDGRLLAPDAFVRTEIDALLTIAPKSVQHWAAVYPRPTNVNELLTWLSGFDAEIKRAQTNDGTQSSQTPSPSAQGIPVPQ